jgi:glycosyltransferase involved in cell wall biosynthesis
MKVLLINNFLYRRGGDCTYMFGLGDLLRRNGHEVFYWGMHHKENYEYEYSRHFVDNINYVEMNSSRTLANVLKVIYRSIYSLEAKKKLETFLTLVKPDIVHLNNIHAYLTPSIIDTINAVDIPIVWTLHDYKLLCPNSIFLSHSDLCFECKGGKYYKCVIRRCKKDSLAASIIAAMEAYICGWLLDISRKVDFFVVMSETARVIFSDFGWSVDRFITINNFKISDYKAKVVREKTYCLFLGSLTPGKGVATLLKAAQSCPDIEVKIAGDGMLRRDLENYIEKNHLKNVTILGHIKDVSRIIADSNFVVVPSECYENFPYAIIEAAIMKKPVIASRVGGIPEMVRENETGLLFERGNHKQLAEKIHYLYDNPQLTADMGENAGKFAESRFDAGKYYQKIIKVYQDAIGMHKTQR